MKNKKNTPWLTLIIGAALVAGAGWYLYNRDEKCSTMDSMQHPATNLDDVPQVATQPVEEVIEVIEAIEEPLAPTQAPALDVIEITEIAQLTDLAQSTQPAVIKFYAPWCGACNHVDSYYKEVAQALTGKVTFYSLNVDNHALTQEAMTLNIPKETIQYLPTFVFFQKGKVQEQQTGVIEKDALIEKVKTMFAV